MVSNCPWYCCASVLFLAEIGEFMKTYTMYFSPTGGTKKVLNTFSQEWKINSWIDFSKLDEKMSGVVFTPEDVCVVAVPSFGGRVKPGGRIVRTKRLSESMSQR